jgi:hypothetical protein
MLLEIRLIHIKTINECSSELLVEIEKYIFCIILNLNLLLASSLNSANGLYNRTNNFY